MTDDDGLAAVVAHRLLGSVFVIDHACRALRAADGAADAGAHLDAIDRSTAEIVDGLQALVRATAPAV